MRSEGRKNDALRPIQIRRNYLRNPEGSVLVEFGNTRVICAATIEDNIPKFLFGKGQGWITAEYGMLPRSTNQRMGRESIRGRGGRTYEIQRLIGRSLRASTQLDMMPEVTVVVDCDVIEADGGTRTAAITGGCIALHDALSKLKLKEHPMNFLVSAVSLGLVNDQIMLDLEYEEDSNAQVDMNVVMSEGGAWIEIQGTAEQRPFRGEELDTMLALAKKGCLELAAIQREVLGLKD